MGRAGAEGWRRGADEERRMVLFAREPGRERASQWRSSKEIS